MDNGKEEGHVTVENTVDLLGGFSARADTISSLKSFEERPTQPNLSAAKPHVQRMEMELVGQQLGTSAPPLSYPKLLQTVGNKAALGNGSGGSSGSPPSGSGRSDYEKYGFALPRYTVPQRAADTFITGDKFDPVQTLFRYDPQSLNVLAEEQFRRNPANAGKSFIKPYDEKNLVYEGLLDKRGVDGFGRAYNSTYGIKDGEYLFDIRDGLSRTKSEIQARLDAGQAVALIEYYAIPEPVDSFAKASSKPWSPQKVDILTREELKERAEREGTEPNYSGVVMKNTVRASRTIGGGEQIFNDGGRAFTFYD